MKQTASHPKHTRNVENKGSAPYLYELLLTYNNPSTLRQQLSPQCVIFHLKISRLERNVHGLLEPERDCLDCCSLSSAEQPNMVLPNSSQIAVILATFILPLLAYVYLNRLQTKPKNTAGPLPAATEVTALYIHPIKSCHGISVQSAKLLPTGLDLGKSHEAPSTTLQPVTDATRPSMDVGNLPRL